MSDDIMDKLCSGCLIYEQYIKNSEHNNVCRGYIAKDTGCPCITCLIKMMCGRACDKLLVREWTKRVK